MSKSQIDNHAVAQTRQCTNAHNATHSSLSHRNLRVWTRGSHIQYVLSKVDKVVRPSHALRGHICHVAGTGTRDTPHTVTGRPVAAAQRSLCRSGSAVAAVAPAAPGHGDRVAVQWHACQCAVHRATRHGPHGRTPRHGGNHPLRAHCGSGRSTRRRRTADAAASQLRAAGCWPAPQPDK